MENAFERGKYAGKDLNITFAPMDGVAELADEVQEFMSEIFGIKEYFVTDESTLSDFAMCCIPKDFSIEASYETLVTSCQDIVVQRILERYHFVVDPYYTILDTVKTIVDQQ